VLLEGGAGPALARREDDLVGEVARIERPPRHLFDLGARAAVAAFGAVTDELELEERESVLAHRVEPSPEGELPSPGGGRRSSAGVRSSVGTLKSRQ
jgi:hypothetical protein